MFNLQNLVDFLQKQDWISKLGMLLVGGIIVALAVIGAIGTWADFEGFFNKECECNDEILQVDQSDSISIDGNENIVQEGNSNTINTIEEPEINVFVPTPIPITPDEIEIAPQSTSTSVPPSPIPTQIPEITVSPPPITSSILLDEETLQDILESTLGQIDGLLPVFGPIPADLPHNEFRIEPKSADVNLINSIIDVNFRIPYSADVGCWDFGILFRDKGINDHMKLIFECGGYWKLIDQSGPNTIVAASGQTDVILSNEGSLNNFRLIVLDNVGILIINDFLIADLNLSRRSTSGDIKIVTGIDERNRVVGQATIVENFSVWSLDDQNGEVLQENNTGKIAFVGMTTNGNEDIYIMNENGTGIKPLVEGDDIARYPTWSPDGSALAYVTNEKGNDDIFLISSENGNKNQLTLSSATDTSPSWSPDGKSIAFLTDRNGTWEIAIFNIEEDTIQILSLNDVFEDISIFVGGLSWSPIDNELAFWAGNDLEAQIYILNLLSLEIRILSEHPSRNFMPEWSPDGKKIAFVSNRDNYHNIFVVEKDGRNLIRLTNDTYSDLRPIWSGDGTKIYFHSSKEQEGASWQIFVMNSDGTNIQAITDGSLGIEGEYFADWSE